MAGCATEEPRIDVRTCEQPTTLRIEDVTIPRSSMQVRELAIDLDGDGEHDNLIGNVTATVTSQTGVELTPLASARLAADVEWQMTMRECGDEVAIDLAPAASSELHLIGTRAPDGSIVATGGDGALPFATLVDLTGTALDPGWLRASRGRIELRPTATGLTGRIAFAIDHELARDTAARTWAPYFDTRTEYHEIFDKAPVDGRITAKEMEQSTLMEALFSPDLDEGASFAIGFTAR